MPRDDTQSPDDGILCGAMRSPAWFVSTNGEINVVPSWLGARQGLRLLGRAGVYVAAGTLRQRQVQAAVSSRPHPVSVDDFDVDEGLAPDEARIYGAWIPPGSRVCLPAAAPDDD